MVERALRRTARNQIAPASSSKPETQVFTRSPIMVLA